MFSNGVKTENRDLKPEHLTLCFSHNHWLNTYLGAECVARLFSNNTWPTKMLGRSSARWHFVGFKTLTERCYT